jgi:hypothetical protein
MVLTSNASRAWRCHLHGVSVNGLLRASSGNMDGVYSRKIRLLTTRSVSYIIVIVAGVESFSTTLRNQKVQLKLSISDKGS